MIRTITIIINTTITTTTATVDPRSWSAHIRSRRRRMFLESSQQHRRYTGQIIVVFDDQMHGGKGQIIMVKLKWSNYHGQIIIIWCIRRRDHSVVIVGCVEMMELRWSSCDDGVDRGVCGCERCIQKMQVLTMRREISRGQRRGSRRRQL